MQPPPVPAAIDAYAQYVLDWATRKGFREICDDCEGRGFLFLSPGACEPVVCPTCKGQRRQFRNFGEQIALAHSELSELMEAYRRCQQNAPDKHCPEFTCAEIEAADLVIRVMDMAAAYGWRLGQAIESKMKYNEQRPYKHGKIC